MTMSDTVCRTGTILKAVATSLQPSRLVLALLMVTLLMLGGQIWDGITPATVSPEGLTAGVHGTELGLEEEGVLRRAQRRWGEENAGDEAPELHAVLVMLEQAIQTVPEEDRSQVERTIRRIESFRPRGAFESTLQYLDVHFELLVEGAVMFKPTAVYTALLGVFYHLPAHLWSAGQGWFLVLYGLFFLLVVAVTGGAMCRMEACQIAANERLTMREAMLHGIETWIRSFMALVVPVVLAGIVCGALLLIGLVFMSIPLVNVLAAIVYGLVLLLGFLLVFILLGYVVSWILLLPAVAVENCEGGDAMQRAFAFVLNRPLHMLAAVIVGIVGLVLGWLVVQLVAVFTVNMTADVVGAWTMNDTFVEAGELTRILGSATDGGRAADSIWYVEWSGSVVGWWMMLVQYLAVGWIFSYIFAASTRIYLLMRHACDGQDERLIWWPGLIPGTLAQEPTAADPSTDSDE